VDVRAIIVVESATLEDLSFRHTKQGNGSPYALAHVLGKPLIFRVIDRLRQSDICKINVVTDVATEFWPTGTAVHGNWASVSKEQLWKSAQQIFDDHSREGAEYLILLRLGPYAEIDYRDLLQFHFHHEQQVTTVADERGESLDVCVMSAAHATDSVTLLEFAKSQCAGEVYPFLGYVNHLSSPNHLRQLAIEALMQRIQLEPEGEQVKPGVWLGRGAQVHKRARILSPAFIGAGSRVRAAAVITRCSALEHHTVVDCGTVVENVTTMPHTYLGAGLDVTHSVVGHSKLFNLKRGVEVEFSDPRLVGEASSRAPLRAMGSLLALASFFPAQLLRGLFAPSHRECPTSLPEAIAAAPAAALETPAPIKATAAPAVDAGEFPSHLAVARRYGNE